MVGTPFLPAALVLAALPVHAQETQQSGTTAAQYAQHLQSAVGREFDGGIVVRAVTAEQNTLVIAVDGPAGWRKALTPETISAGLVQGFCQEAASFFDSGVTMRVDSLQDGAAPQKGSLVTRCP